MQAHAERTKEVMMIFLVVEDNPEHAKSIQAALEVFEQAAVMICDSEAAFEGAFPRFIADPPRLVVLDLRVRAASPTASMFSQSLPSSSDRAGHRILKMLLGNDRTKNVDVIIYTSLYSSIPPDMLPLPDHIRFEVKSEEHKALLMKIESIIPELRRKRLPFWRRVWNALSFRLPGVSVSTSAFKKK